MSNKNGAPRNSCVHEINIKSHLYIIFFVFCDLLFFPRFSKHFFSNKFYTVAAASRLFPNVSQKSMQSMWHWKRSFSPENAALPHFPRS